MENSSEKQPEPGIGRFLFLAAIGIVGAYLIGPLSPLPGAHVWGVAVLIAAPLAMLAYALLRLALSPSAQDPR